MINIGATTPRYAGRRPFNFQGGSGGGDESDVLLLENGDQLLLETDDTILLED